MTHHVTVTPFTGPTLDGEPRYVAACRCGYVCYPQGAADLAAAAGTVHTQRAARRPARRAATAVLAVALMGGGLAAVAAPAEAANPRCLSKPEFRKIHKGMSPARVARIVGSPGHVAASSSSGGYRFVIRDFKTCTRYGAASVSFSADPGEALSVDGKFVAW